MVEFALENNTQQQNQSQQDLLKQSSLTGAISRTTTRIPDDATESGRDRDNNKNAVTKTYHTLKDLISSKFKKDSNGEIMDELNNVVVQQQQQQQQHTQPPQQQQAFMTKETDEYRSPYSALPVHMRQMQALNQSQPNIWNGKQMDQQHVLRTSNGQQQNLTRSNGRMDRLNGHLLDQRATSQPQLNGPTTIASFDTIAPSGPGANGTAHNRNSIANMDVVTDSDDGGFATRTTTRRYQIQQQQPNSQVVTQQQQQRVSPHHGPNYGQPQQLHLHPQHQQQQYAYQQSNGNSQQYGPLQGASQIMHNHNPNQQPIYNEYNSAMGLKNESLKNGHEEYSANQSRQDAQRASFQNRMLDNHQQTQQQQQIQQPQPNATVNQSSYKNYRKSQPCEITGKESSPPYGQAPPQPTTQQNSGLDIGKQVTGSANSSDYDKSGNHSSNVDSGRGSAAYSSGRKATLDNRLEPGAPGSDFEGFELSVRGGIKNDDSEWVDIVDAELRHILGRPTAAPSDRRCSTVEKLDPLISMLTIRPESTVSGSVSSISPPLPPLSPDGSSYKPTKSTKEPGKQEYGTDSYNRPGRASGPIGPSRAGWPGSSLQKQAGRTTGKKHEQTMLKRHLFGLDNDLTSNTTLSLDVESLLGGPWGTGQSVSDSETDTQDIRHIRSQLEGLEHMYSEVLKMLGTRNPGGRLNESTGFRPGIRRRHGSLSSLPSSSVSGRPIRDRKRTDDRRKVRDMKGINKRFQRLESHVVTLARSVAHLSSEMRSQHLVTQELERLRDDLANLRSQANRSQNLYRSSSANNNEPEPPNLTNPKRVKKLTKFFGEDPPLMRLFLKKLGYEKYANLFEAERVGMIELPYLGEERLQKLGVPLGPRLRILQEAQISLCKDTTLCIV